MHPPFALERVVQSDRLVIVGAVAAVTLLAWFDLVRMASMMPSAADAATRLSMPEMAGMPDPRVWNGRALFALFAMWDVMMIGMMLPSAAPLILLVAGIYRRRGGRGARGLTATFTLGYLLAWTMFSAVAAGLQVGLHRAALMSPAMVSQSAWLGGGILVAAGVYQWLPVKNACLSHCRSPLHFLGAEWREGARGALIMGARHGSFCVGCCWALMALLFAVGVMNLAWVAALTIFVLVEKATRAGQAVGRAAGAGLVIWGAWVLAHP